MIGRVPHWSLLVGIVIAASACDNVSWGGVEWAIRAPAADSAAPTPDSGRAAEPEPRDQDPGPLLYAGVRDGDAARIFPVAILTEEGLHPLPVGPEGEEASRRLLSRRLAPGTALPLFHQGVRVGTMEVEEAGLVTEPYCGVRAQAFGRLQLVPEAAEAERFIALEPERVSGFGFGSFQTLSSVYDQRVASLNLGAEAIPLVGASWPASLLETRRDIQVFELPGAEAPAVMATFVHGDDLRVGPAPDSAYALMILGEPRGSTFDLAFTWYRKVGEGGKGAPRYFSRLDWDRDGDQEILLEVMGEEARWFAALNRGPDGWVLTYQDPCGDPGDGGA